MALPTGSSARGSELAIGEGSIYHPGGMDYDGKSIRVPAAEYRPNSRAISYAEKSTLYIYEADVK